MQNYIDKGISFLLKKQQKDGFFLSLSSPSQTNFSRAKKYHSIFPSALILSAVCGVKNTTQTKQLKKSLEKFLATQKSDNWSFNYWARDAKENKTLPYPDDLDDTFCSLTALFKHNPKSIDGKALAKIVSILTFTEEKEGGPYRTWLVPPDSEKVWLDVDLAVNSNIAYFLSLQDIELENITALVEKAIDDKVYHSPYYPSEYSIIYFISRFYIGEKKKKIIDFLISRQNKSGNWGNPLETALALSSLINLGFKDSSLEKGISYLVKNQSAGSWPASAFCIDPAINRKTYYAGSDALTTAFCIEALNKYQMLCDKQNTKDVNKKKVNRKDKIYKDVVKQAKERFSTLDTDLKKHSTKTLNKILKSANSEQIVLTPYFFKEALGKNGKGITDEMITNLGLANLYGWIAYTIYDDFLDDEGDPRLLSTANLCLRELNTIFKNIALEAPGFESFYQKILDKIDAANTWETSHCRGKIKDTTLIPPKPLPNYGKLTKLADRSLGHALGPLAILFSLGYTEKSKEVKDTLKFFKHYIIAKQLNDDAHDWEDDLKTGQISAVCIPLIRAAKKQRIPLSIKKEGCNELQALFWNDIIDNVCKNALNQTNLARKTLSEIDIIHNKKILEKLLTPTEKGVRKAMCEKRETLKFLNTY
ncbi:hypothetical protein ACFL0K_00600 [Patescibacteria group bacterium]